MADEKNTDVVAQLESARAEVTKLTTERDGLRTQLTTAQSEVTRITAERNTAQTALSTAQTNVTAAQAEVTKLTTERNTAQTALTAAQGEVTKLQASQKDFDGKVRAELVKHGIRAEALPLPKVEAGSEGGSGTGAGGKETLTQKALRMMKEGQGGKPKDI